MILKDGSCILFVFFRIAISLLVSIVGGLGPI
jgi:hypothetical protein